MRVLSLWLGLVLAVAGCTDPAVEAVAPAPRRAVEWSRDATIYEVNLRQFSESGSFAALEEELPRLKALGVKILWLMPIHPIGKDKRKGTLGSYYAVRDYRGVNPEHGSLADFKRLVARVHEQGMLLILDWVANHTAWDHPWVRQHPDWYTRDDSGAIQPPVADWSDVADLNYDAPGLRSVMLEALAYWVEEADIDGYRCDVAGMVPLDFWRAARAKLDAIKPVFLLAEAEDPKLHDAFDMTYAWSTHGLMGAVARGEKSAADLGEQLVRDAKAYPGDAIRMQFTSNHDENSWNGTVKERLGEGAEAFAALSVLIPGMPLVYCGQEAGLDRRLKFFDKDVIDWRPHPDAKLYTELLGFHRSNRLLWNGASESAFARVATDSPEAVLAFTRGDAELLAVFNLSGQARSVRLEAAIEGSFKRALGKDEVLDASKKGTTLTLGAWEWRVYLAKP